MTHADHPDRFDAGCEACWRGMRSDNIVPLSWTDADPLTPDTDEEPWRYTPDPVPTRRGWLVVALVLVVVMLVVLARWPE